MINVENLRKHGYTVQWYLTDVAKYLALWSVHRASEKYGFNYVLGGGTALNDTYFPRERRRFSRDIDLFLVNIEPTRFLNYVNLCLKEAGYFKTLDVIGRDVVVQGLIYEGVRRNNVVFKFRTSMPPNFPFGRKLTDILPATIKREREFNKWYMENKKKLPKTYEIEVTIFRGEKPHAHDFVEKQYSLPILGFTDWINLPSPFSINTFSLEDLVASKFDAIVSGMVAKGFISGKITGRRTVKVRDVYDVTLAFYGKLYSKEKLLESLSKLNLDVRYSVKAIRLSMLQTLIEPTMFRSLVEVVPSLRGNLKSWVTMVLEAYNETLNIHEHTPEDYIAYEIVTNRTVNLAYVKRKFGFSKSQLTHIMSKLEKLGFIKNRGV